MIASMPNSSAYVPIEVCNAVSSAPSSSMAPSSATRNGSLPSFEFQAFNPFRPAFMESGLALKESSISVKEVPSRFTVDNAMR